MITRPITDEGYKLLHQGSIALSQVEANGIRVDTEYLGKAISGTTRKIKKVSASMKKNKIYKTWRREFGERTNIGSGEQLGRILFTIMKHPCSDFTESGRPKVDADALSSVDLPFVRKFTKLAKLKKVNSTYLQGILRESVDGFLHPFFNLNLNRTFRGQSDHPNFQNMPIRDPEFARLVRRAFISRPNHQVTEVDYSGVEICNAACYHLDPRMIRYIKTGPGRLHTDMAGKCYMLPHSQITKDVRYCGKNMFVFPEFYGDYYLHCAQSLWKAITQMNLERVDGCDLLTHLEEKGIYTLGTCDPDQSPEEGTFEEHLQNVEYDFWNKRFKVYGQWKKDWWFEYLKKGYFDTLTGFRIEGLFKRNEVINYPVQGSAFHWLLWSLIRIQKLLRKYHMRSVIVGQIHDSIVSDVHKKELKDYLEIAKQVMTIDVRKHWKWIIVPLEIEAEVAPVGGSWYEKEKVKI